MRWESIMSSVQNYLVKGSRINCNGSRIQVEEMGMMLKYTRRENSRTFRNRKNECLKEKINELEINSKKDYKLSLE